MDELLQKIGIDSATSLLSAILIFLVAAVIFGIGLIVPAMRGNDLGRIGLWCGFISQLLLAVVMYSEIRRNRKEQNN